MTTSTTDLKAFLAEARRSTNAVLETWCDRARREIPGPVGQAIAYSLSAPGKRLRPALVLALYQELGGNGDVSEIAAAVEVVHTYSLVHDDLPCMDNDDLRRGRPTTHRQFDVATAGEAGLAMVPLAARVLAAGCTRLGCSDEVLGRVAAELFRAAGAAGMIGGQVLDLEAEGRPVAIEYLREIHRRKTGALIEASAVIGAIAGGAAPSRLAAVRAWGREVGVAFQIADDVLDTTATSQELGKTAGKDARQRKATFATLLGPEAAMEEARARIDRAIALLGESGIDSSLLQGLANFIVNRRS
ncbi:MAG: polyprenyl synthetase family protein [Gemmatimonadetes bacterium]|nr:polyprenyl synthetase family protein [Gemmatimonadota bacterium]